MTAWIAYLTVALVWGSTFFAIAWAIPSFTPFGLNAARFLPAGLLVLLIGRLRGEAWPRPRELPRLMGVGALLLTVCMALIAWAESRVASGVTATLGATVPLYLAMLSPRGLRWGQAAGLALGFGGVALLVRPWGGGPDVAGCVVLAGSAFLWSLGTLWSREDGSRAGHFTKVAVEMLTAGVLSLAAAAATGGITHAALDGRSLAALAYLILFGSVAAYSAYIHVTRVWPPARAGSYAFWNPAVAVALGCAFRGEPFTPSMGAGFVLILGGVALVLRRSKWGAGAGPGHRCAAPAPPARSPAP